MKSFKEFISSKSEIIKEEKQEINKDWKKEFIKLEKGFVPPSNMKPIIMAFADSNNISIMNDTSKEINMPKKSLYLTGGSVRDFLKNKTPKNYNLVTNATPEQVELILSNAGFKEFEESDEESKTYHRDGDAVVATVKNDKFEIETLKKSNSNEYTDSIEEDAKRRDLTINSMYIELSKDGENNKLYDPTKKGWYDVTHGNIKSVGNPQESFKNDKLRMMRTIRFYSQYGKGELDKDIKKAMVELKSEINEIPFQKIREEFLKGLLHPDIDPRKYLQNYSKLEMIEKIFPDVSLNMEVPPDFSNKKDKILALAWILQDNSIEEVRKALSSIKKIKDEDQKTGWTGQERNSVVLLLKLKDFNLDEIDDLLEMKKFSGLSEEQIRNWVELFNVEGKSPRPLWSKQIKNFAKFSPKTDELLNWNSDEIGESSPLLRRKLLKNINRDKLKQMFKDSI
jgi:tRNA nucleotidyltransferase/poly(A) polymerase